MSVRLILGIETSCDETAAAVVAIDSVGEGQILSNVVHSQLEDHAAYGGVVPELAARAHGEKIDVVVRRALGDAKAAVCDIDGIAATAGPGLIGGLMVGLTAAKALALAAGKPLFAINHLEGHALTARLTDGLEFPFLLLLVSGGHTQILLVEDVGRYTRLGTTIDDALGEAFDKTAKLLGLSYPGGPAVEQAALQGDAKRFVLPQPMRGKPGCDFSFSGLKTAIRQTAQATAPLTDQDVADICASFQATVRLVLRDRLARAFERIGPPLPLVVAGGVAANKALRAELEVLADENKSRLVAPPLHLCTDNAAMIAWAGAERMAAGFAPDGLACAARSRWPLDQLAEPVIGHGKRGAKA